MKDKYTQGITVVEVLHLFRCSTHTHTADQIWNTHPFGSQYLDFARSPTVQWPVHAKSLGSGEEPYFSIAAVAMRSHGMCLLPEEQVRNDARRDTR